MSRRCAFKFSDGRRCQRFPSEDSRFCHHHDPRPDLLDTADQDDPEQHPLVRIASPQDAFTVVREAINAVRMGRMRPHQAYALSCLLNVWLRLRDAINDELRVDGLHHQIIPTLHDFEEAASYNAYESEENGDKDEEATEEESPDDSESEAEEEAEAEEEGPEAKAVPVNREEIEKMVKGNETPPGGAARKKREWSN